VIVMISGPGLRRVESGLRRHSDKWGMVATSEGWIAMGVGGRELIVQQYLLVLYNK